LTCELRLKIGDESPLKRQADVLYEVCEDLRILGSQHSDAKWRHRTQEYVQACDALDQFVAVIEPLRSCSGLNARLKTVLRASLAQDFKPSPAKDMFYELRVAAALKLAGFSVKLAEPDIILSGAGLSKPLAIACKYPSSRQQIHSHVSNGYWQLARQGLEGVVCVGLDLIVGIEANLQGIMDFRQVEQSPLETQWQQLANETDRLFVERRRDYPSERGLDGLMMTVSVAGFTANPLTLKRFESFALGCLQGNPLDADLAIIERRVNALRDIDPRLLIR
jgi:hypothetical protein